MVETKQNKDREQKYTDSKEYLELLKKRKDYFKKLYDFSKRDLEISKKLLDFEVSNSKIRDGKPEYLFMDAYMDLVNERKQLDFEIREMKLKDEIARTEKAIEDIDKEIKSVMKKLGYKV